MENNSLLKEFKKTEKKLIKILKSNPLVFSEKDEGERLKDNIKVYIEKIKEAKKLFSEYEKLAKKIQDFDDEDENLVLKKQEVENILQKKSQNLMAEQKSLKARPVKTKKDESEREKSQ